VKNEDAYVKEFVPLAQASIKNHGGVLLAAGPKVTAQAWRSSADYKGARETGEKYATFRSYLFEGVSK
jgi:hypothetical protein